MEIKKTLLLTMILLCGNIIRYYRGGNDFRVDQPYRGREILSSSYKFIVYFLPAVCIFWSYHKQSRVVRRIPLRGRGAIGLAIAMIGAKNMLYGSTGTNPNNTLLTVVYVLLINSTIEEYVFRGLLFSSLQKGFPTLQANVIQAMFFGLIHIPFYCSIGKSGFSLLGGICGVICLGLRRGWVKRDTGSLFYPILLHSIWNGILLFL